MLSWYPRFWPGCAGVMVARGVDWKSYACPECGAAYTRCCRPEHSADSRRICECGTLSVLSPVLVNDPAGPSQTVSYHPVPRQIRCLPRNWQAALLRAAYGASPAEHDRLARKSRRMLDRLGRLAEKAQQGSERANERGRKLYQRYQRLQAVRLIYRA